MTQFLPLIVDAPACNMPAPGDGIDEPIVVQLRTAGGEDVFVPLSVAAAQALVQLLLREEQNATVEIRLAVADCAKAPVIR